MSSKHIYFFDKDNEELHQVTEYVVKKYSDCYFRQIPQCGLPEFLENYYAYTADDNHVNIGIGQKSLNSELFKLIYHENTVDFMRSLVSKAEETERCALKVKHMLFDLILCCNVDTVGVTALPLSDDAENVNVDLSKYKVIRESIWNVTVESLTGLDEKSILLIYKE